MRHGWVFVLLVSVAAPCVVRAQNLPDVPGISKPVIVGPLYPCSNVVKVTGFPKGATVKVFVDGVQRANPVAGYAPFLVYLPNFALSQDQKVKATASLGPGDDSPESEIVTVEGFPADQPLPRPMFHDVPLYECGLATDVTNFVPGSHVYLYEEHDPYSGNLDPVADFADVGSPSTKFDMRAPPLPLARPFGAGFAIVARYELCDHSRVSPLQREIVMPAPPQLPAPVVEFRAGTDLVHISNLVQGSTITIKLNGAVLNAFPISVKEWHTGVGRGLLPGDRVEVSQQICGNQSSTSGEVYPLPCDISPPTIRTPQIGDDFVILTSSAGMEARIRVFDQNFVEIGDGGGGVGPVEGRINLNRAIHAGDSLFVKQTLGTCSAQSAAAIAPACKATEVFTEATGPFGAAHRPYQFELNWSGTIRVSGEVYYPTYVGGDYTGPVIPWGGAFPVVAISHGQHNTHRAALLPNGDRDWTAVDKCPPLPAQGGPWSEVQSWAGYGYLAEALARRGFIVIAPNFNDLNCNADALAMRRELLQHHLEKWNDVNTGAQLDPNGAGLKGRLDMERIGLVGHSMGGWASERLAAFLATAPPADNPAGLHIRAVVPLAPYEDAGGTSLTGIPLLTILGADDQDVPLSGGETYDRAEEGSDPRWFKSQLTIRGANHQQFNSTWLWEDNQEPPGTYAGAGGTLLGRSEQEGIVRAYAGAFFDYWLKGDDSVLPLFTGDGSSITGVSTSPLDWSFRAAGDYLIDNFEDLDQHNLLDGTIDSTFNTSVPWVFNFGGNYTTNGFKLAWLAAGKTFKTPWSPLDLPVPLNLRAAGPYSFLTMRATLLSATDRVIRVGLVDGVHSQTEPTDTLRRLPLYTGGFFSRSIRVPIRCIIEKGGLNADTIGGVVIESGADATGTIGIDDIAFSKK